jgi:hypothetical protein
MNASLESVGGFSDTNRLEAAVEFRRCTKSVDAERSEQSVAERN